MQPFVIGICGGSGSGKTSFIRRLRDLFPEESLCIISQDDYYHPREEQQVDNRGVINFDLPEAIDRQALRNDLGLLMRGESVRRMEYTFNNGAASSRELVFRPAPVLVVEGLFVFHFENIKPVFDLKVFINAKDNLKVIRRILRDQVERNYPIEDVLYRYQHHVLPAFEQFILPYRDEADVVINNNQDFEKGLFVLSGFIRSRLAELR